MDRRFNALGERLAKRKPLTVFAFGKLVWRPKALGAGFLVSREVPERFSGE
jgi:hypothetical protein